jgi:hypothetical protein
VLHAPVRRVCQHLYICIQHISFVSSRKQWTCGLLFFFPKITPFYK